VTTVGTLVRIVSHVLPLGHRGFHRVGYGILGPYRDWPRTRGTAQGTRRAHSTEVVLTGDVRGRTSGIRCDPTSEAGSTLVSNFWNFRRQPATQGSAAIAEEAAQPEPVELYTSAALVTGSIMPEGRRLSDILNGSSLLRLRQPHLTPYRAGLQLERTGEAEWRSVDTADVLFVAPPEHTSARQMRVHRKQRRVRIAAGDFEITGVAHVPPGNDLAAYLRRSGVRFLPLTNAVAYSRADPAWERVAPVLLVNAKHMSDVTEVVTIA
jgi:hypothetical protein